MECTQRLECTQELYSSQTEAVCPEQIGFLGICGAKYPVKRGPNKIGRDASVCSIVLNLDSISRNHAVINIMNRREYMLMDLDSANKTRLNNKVLQPYIPYPLNNCDTVQFGTVFGVFRLLVDDHELPSTQAIDVPDTPVHNKHASRVKGAVTTIPESPDISDRDDSFIMPSQPKEKHSFKSPNTAKYIKKSTNTVAIQPIGSHQIDNVFWNSNKKSLSTDDSGSFDDDSMVTANTTCQANIHEMDTQPPNINKIVDPNDSIYTADTQMPNICRDSIYTADTQFANDENESIFTAATQMPEKVSPNINTVDTQMPEHLPAVYKKSDQHDMQLDIYAANKENISVHNAETQLFADKHYPSTSKNVHIDEDDDIFNAATQFPFNHQNTPDDYEKDVSIFEADTQFTTGNNEVDNTEQQKYDSAKVESVLDDLEQDISIFEADTQFTANKDDNVHVESKKEQSEKDTLKAKKQETESTSAEDSASTSKTKPNTTSDEEILFDELDGQSFEEAFESQPLIPSEEFELMGDDPEIPLSQTMLKKSENETSIPEIKQNCTPNHCKEDITILPTQKLPTSDIADKKLSKDSKKQTRETEEKQNLTTITNTLENDDFSLLPTQKLSTVAAHEDDATDCESSDNESNKITTSRHKSPEIGSKNTLSSLHTGTRTDSPAMSFENSDLEDMATQTLKEDTIHSSKILQDDTKKVTDAKLDIPVEDMVTQVLIVPEVINDDVEIPFEEIATQVLEEEEFLHEIDTKNSKDTEDMNRDVLVDSDIIDLATQILPKSNDLSLEGLPTQVLEEVPEKNSSGSFEQYSEELISSFKVPFEAPLKRKSSSKRAEPKTIVSPIVSIVKKPLNVSNAVPPSNDDEENHYECTQDILKDLSSQNQESPSKSQNATVKTDSQVAPLKRANSDSQDTEVTPKKVHPMKLMYLDLPDSQEIKTSVSLASRLSGNSETQSSESEPEQNSEEMTPIVFRKKRKKALNVKTDLIKKFEASTAPTRVISRVRHPTAKLLESNILKDKKQTDSQDNVDTEIITENITRLKSKTEKKTKGADSKISQTKTSIETDKVCEPKEHSKANSETKVSIQIEKSPQKIIKKKGAKKTETAKVKATNYVEINIKPKKETKTAKTDKDSDNNRSPKKKNTAKGKNNNSKVKKDLEDNLTESKSNISEVKIGETSGVKTRSTRSCKTNQIYNTSKYRTSKERSATPSIDLTLQPSRTSKERSATPVDLTLQPSSTKGRRNQKNIKIPDKDDTIDLTKTDTSQRKSKTDAKEKQFDETKTAKTENTKETRKRAKGKQAKSSQIQTSTETESENSVRRSRRQKMDSQKDTLDKYLVDKQKSPRKGTSTKSVDKIDQKSTHKGTSTKSVDKIDQKSTQKGTNTKSVDKFDQKSTQKGTTSLEISTVYSKSSDVSVSSDNTPLSMKRRAPNHIEIEAPIPKRTRSSSRGVMSIRATPARMLKSQHVLFTAFNNNDVKLMLEKLGAVIVTDVKACTMVLTLAIKRTFKLLCAVGLGVPIVGPSWVQACLETKMIVDPWQYILKDDACENRFQFSLQRTLAGRRGFLKGYNVSSTPKVLPDKREMKLIVECSGGTWKESVPNWICVSNPVDKALWPDLIAEGATIVSTEFILSGVLTQVADVERNRLA